MIVGVSPKAGDITVNVCKGQLTNMRAAGATTRCASSPENPEPRAVPEFLADDELLEVTPLSFACASILDHGLACGTSRRKALIAAVHIWRRLRVSRHALAFHGLSPHLTAAGILKNNAAKGIAAIWKRRGAHHFRVRRATLFGKRPQIANRGYFLSCYFAGRVEQLGDVDSPSSRT